MLNQVILVGKVNEIIKDKEDVIITLEVKRVNKEPGEEEYQTDFIDVQLSKNLSVSVLEYIRENTTVGVKARIEQRDLAMGKTIIKTHAIIAEKITFINTKKYED